MRFHGRRVTKVARKLGATCFFTLPRDCIRGSVIETEPRGSTLSSKQGRKIAPLDLARLVLG